MDYLLQQPTDRNLKSTVSDAICGSTCSIVLAMILGMLSFALAAQAQQDDTPSEEVRPRKVIMTIEKEALRIPKDIGQVNFRYPSKPNQGQGTGNASEYVESVIFFAEERRLGTTVKGKRVERSAMTVQEREEYFQVRSRELQSLWERYRPELIRRGYRPPFDTLAISPRTGEVVHLNDRTRHYVVILRDSVDRPRFIEEAKRLPGITGVRLPAVIEPLGGTSPGSPRQKPVDVEQDVIGNSSLASQISYFPDDSLYLSDQWYLQNQTVAGQETIAGTAANEAWPVMLEPLLVTRDGFPDTTRKDHSGIPSVILHDYTVRSEPGIPLNTGRIP